VKKQRTHGKSTACWQNASQMVRTVTIGLPNKNETSHQGHELRSECGGTGIKYEWKQSQNKNSYSYIRYAYSTSFATAGQLITISKYAIPSWPLTYSNHI
jgi:hypothetical protein